jgi:hypothetical protein
MLFDVIEDNERWWLRLSRSVWVGPFAERTEALQWARSFAGDDRDISMHRERKRKRLRIVGGEAA